MKDVIDYKYLNDEKIQNYTANHFPEGRAWAKKNHNTSWLYKFILCLAQPFKYLQNLIYILIKNTNIDTADELLENWEKDSSVGDLFPRLDTIAKRRDAVNKIQSKIPVANINKGGVSLDTTYEDYIKKVLDIDVSMYIGAIGLSTSAFPLVFPVVFGRPWRLRTVTFFISVGGEAYPYSDTITRKLNTVLDRIIPSYCVWKYVEEIV